MANATLPKGEGTIILDEEESATISKVAVRLPVFWPEETELWFAQLEGQFTICGIMDDDTKYAYVFTRVELQQTREIRDVIRNPPSTGKYKAIKTALIQRLLDPQELRIRKLMEHEEIGDRKPSQFLRHLSTLAGAAVSDKLIRTLWLSRLPPQTQAILATRKGDNLQDIADQAVRIDEVNDRALVLTTAQPSTSTTASPPTWTEQISKLTQQVAALTAQMTKLNKQSRRERSRSRTRGHARSRHRSKAITPEGVCCYHRRFGEEARKCTQPCTYTKKD